MIQHNVTGIVLAGGKSSRMGTDKALLIFRGKPLIQYAVDILGKVCGQIIISANKDDYAFTGCETWPDEFPIQAPMIGIYSCLKRSKNEVNIVLSCDMPMVDPVLFTVLLEYSKDHDIVLPVHDGDCVEPLCGIYNRRVAPTLEEHIRRQQYGLRQFAETTGFRAVEINPGVHFNNGNMFVNINTSLDFDLHSRT